MKVRLSSNESNFGPSPAAIEAARAVASDLHVYPDDQSVALRTAVADLEGTTPELVTMGTGSCGLLMDLIAEQCHDGGAVLGYEQAFIVYRLAARNAGVPYLEAPVGGPATPGASGYARDPQALLDAITDDVRVVVVDNPGNPTGVHLDAEGLAAVVAGVPDHVTLVVDEAYWQYAAGLGGYARARDLDVGHPRLVVTSTFSKAYALAALRVGYAVGPADLIGGVDAWRTRFNVNAVAQVAALASLSDTDHLRMAVEGTIEGRDRMAAGLRDLGVPFTEGLANFLLIELGEQVAPYVEAFAWHDVGVRPLLPYAMTEQLRISVGTPDEVDAFLDAAATVLAGAPSRA